MNSRRELEAGPPSFHTRRWVLARPLVWAQGADPEKCGQGLENRTKTEATSHVPDRAAARAGRPVWQSRSLDTGRRLEPAARR